MKSIDNTVNCSDLNDMEILGTAFLSNATSSFLIFRNCDEEMIIKIMTKMELLKNHILSMLLYSMVKNEKEISNIQIAIQSDMEWFEEVAKFFRNHEENVNH